MNSIDVIEKISNTNLVKSDLKYCLVNSSKLPYTINNELAKTNQLTDFVSLEELLQCDKLDEYNGIGISIQASKICAIDIDHCFKIKNDITSIDKRGKDILDYFKRFAYCEFSFSGTGLRILFKTDLIDNYSSLYYIKNEKNQIEYYQPTKSFRYVTITGNVISNNEIKYVDCNFVKEFLNKYMKKPERIKRNIKEVDDNRDINTLMKKVRVLYLKDSQVQDLWFKHAPGSHSNESELDYQLLAILYERITQNKDKLKEIFEQSPYFKSKDWKHVNKWNYQDFRYYNYLFEQIERSH